MKQADRAIDWSSDPTARIVRRIRAADSSPGVLDATLFGEEIFLYGAHEEDRLRGAPGQFLAQREGAVCIGTVDGALWVSHLKAKSLGPYAGIKLPAAQVLGRAARGRSRTSDRADRRRATIGPSATSCIRNDTASAISPSTSTTVR